ncbi:MAG: hypothetical protein U1E93_09725 [Alphaproteobacteria bacterium]
MIHLEEGKIILRPSLRSMVVVAMALSPGWGAGLWQVMRHDPFVGLVLCAMAFALWFYGVGSLRIVADNETIEMFRLFWREWGFPISGLTIRQGAGGDIPMLPAIVLEQSSGARGAILLMTFNGREVWTLLSFLKERGAKIPDQSSHKKI